VPHSLQPRNGQTNLSLPMAQSPFISDKLAERSRLGDLLSPARLTDHSFQKPSHPAHHEPREPPPLPVLGDLL